MWFVIDDGNCVCVCVCSDPDRKVLWESSGGITDRYDNTLFSGCTLAGHFCVVKRWMLYCVCDHSSTEMLHLCCQSNSEILQELKMLQLSSQRRCVYFENHSSWGLKCLNRLFRKIILTVCQSCLTCVLMFICRNPAVQQIQRSQERFSGRPLNNLSRKWWWEKPLWPVFRLCVSSVGVWLCL